MSRNPQPELLRLTGLSKDLGGGLTIRRLLPSLQCRAVGPFVFFDHMGPVTVRPDSRIDVRPHPHIGLATVTYLFEGAMQHRDSLGHDQIIEPGAINWMTAGRGIVHSERRPVHLARTTYVNHGIQLWAALPRSHEQTEPAFVHTSADDIPVLQAQGVQVRLLIGSAWGEHSPVATLSPMLYLDVELDPGAAIELPPLVPEMAIYTVRQSVYIGAELVAPHTLVPLPQRRTAYSVEAGSQAARFVVIGGEPLDGPRHLWWNFVASDKALIEQAVVRWEDNAMGRVAGDDERIPLPRR